MLHGFLKRVFLVSGMALIAVSAYAQKTQQVDKRQLSPLVFSSDEQRPTKTQVSSSKLMPGPGGIGQQQGTGGSGAANANAPVLEDPVETALDMIFSGKRSNSGTAASTAVPKEPAAAATNAGPRGFEAQLNALIDAFGDRFSSMMGEKQPGSIPSWYSKISLEGSTETYVSGNRHLVAKYGEFKTRSEAEAVYKRLVSTVNSAKKKCCLFLSGEHKAEAATTTYWLSIDVLDNRSAVYEDLVLEVEVVTVPHIDKDLKVTDEFDVVFRIREDN